MIRSRTALVHVSPVASNTNREVAAVSLPAEPWAGGEDIEAREAVIGYLRRASGNAPGGWLNKMSVRDNCGFANASVAQSHLNALVREGSAERRKTPGKGTSPYGEYQWRAAK